MADLGTLVVTIGVNSKDAQRKIEELTTVIETLGAKVTSSSFANSFALFSKNTISHLAMTSQRLRTFGYLASATLTAPSVLAGKSLMKTTSDYEYSVQKIVGLTGTAQEEVNQWSKEVLKFAIEFGKKPKELAEALYFIASSGIKGAEALNVLKVSAKAATTGLGETQTIANYLTSVLNAYRGTGLTAAYATDVLVAAVREGKAEAEGFAAAMGSVTPLASKLGVSIDQVAGAMAAVTLTGSTAAQAATYLRGMFNVLLKETEQGEVAMEDASEALGQMKTSYSDLRKILREQGVMALMQKLNELTAAYGETLVAKVFPNIRAMLGVLSLSGKNMQYNSKIIKEITESTGALSEAFKAVSSTAKVRYDVAMAKLAVTSRTFGKTLLELLIPIFESLIQKLQKLTDYFSKLDDAEKKSILKKLALVAALGPLSMAFSVLGYSITGVMNILDMLGKVIVKSSVCVEGFGLKLILATLRVSTFGAGLITLAKAFKTLFIAMVTTPIGAFVTALATIDILLIKAIANMKERMAEMREALSFETPEMTLTKDIDNLLYAIDSKTGKVVSNLKNLSNEQLYELKSYVEQRTLLAKQAYENAIKYSEKEIENEKEVIRQRQIIEDAQLRWEHFKAESRRGLHTDYERLTTGSTISLEIQRAQQYIDSRKKMVEYDKLATKSDLDRYNSLSKTIDSEISKRNLAMTSAISASNTMTDGINENLKKEKSALEEILQSYRERIAYIEMMDKLSEGGRTFEFDVLGEKLDLVKNTLEQIVKEFAKLGDVNLFKSLLGPVGLFGNMFSLTMTGLVNQIKTLENEIEALANAKEMELLRMEAEAFGTMAARVEVLNGALEGARREFRKLLNEYRSGTGAITWDDVLKAANNIKDIKISLEEAKSAMDLQYLQDMNNALGDFSTGTDLLQGYISVLTNKLQILSEVGKGSTEQFKQIAGVLSTLKFAEWSVTALSDAFTELFQAGIEGVQDFGSIFKKIIRNLIDELVAFLAKLMAMQIILAIFGGKFDKLTRIADATKILGKVTPLIGAGIGLANGGVVKGPIMVKVGEYSNARTNPEIVAPLSKLNEFIDTKNIKVDISVDGVIAGRDIALVLRRNG